MLPTHLQVRSSLQAGMDGTSWVRALALGKTCVWLCRNTRLCNTPENPIDDLGQKTTAAAVNPPIR